MILQVATKGEWSGTTGLAKVDTSLQSIIGQDSLSKYMVQCCKRDKTGMRDDQHELSQAQVEELQVIFNKVQEVFEKPEGLPPKRCF